jgi:hypothetical protein
MANNKIRTLMIKRTSAYFDFCFKTKTILQGSYRHSKLARSSAVKDGPYNIFLANYTLQNIHPSMKDELDSRLGIL